MVFCRKLNKTRLRRTIHDRISVLRPCIIRFMHRFAFCSDGNKYRMLPLPSPSPVEPQPSPSPSPLSATEDSCGSVQLTPPSQMHTHELDSDSVSLKISLLGDCQIGKTSFLVRVFLNHFDFMIFPSRVYTYLKIRYR